MGKDNDRPMFDANASDSIFLWQILGTIASWKIMLIPSKDIDSAEYWIAAKRPKALAALRRAFPQAEWDVLTKTIDAQIPPDNKLKPAKWLTQITKHYLGGEPIIQSTHNFLCILKQEPSMSIQDWHTTVRLNYQKCDFRAAVDDRLQQNLLFHNITLWRQ